MQQDQQKNTGIVKDEISLRESIYHVKEWWRYIVSKWKVTLVVAIIGSILGLVYSLMTPIFYKAETVFVLENTEGSGDYAGIAEKFGLSLGGGGGEGLFSDDDNIITFLKSRTIGVKTLLTPVNFDGREQLMIERYIAFNNLRNKWKNPKLKAVSFSSDPSANSLLADSILTVIHKTILKKNLDISKPDKEGNIIVISTLFNDEVFSKVYSEKLMSNATGFYTKTITQKSQENVDILQQQSDSIKQLLNNAISGVASTTDANVNLNPAYQRLKVPSQKRLIDVEMNKAILEELVKNLELAKITLRRESPLVQIIDKPVLPLEKKKTGKLKGIVLGIGLIEILLLIYLSIRLYLRKILSNPTI